MDNNVIYIGDSLLRTDSASVVGSFVELDGEVFYKISNYDLMPPFLISLVSHSDHWMFISSNGGCTAGRKNPDHALFPYYTDDKIHDSHNQTGGKTILFVNRSGRTSLWEPFSHDFPAVYSIERNLYKNMYGNTLIFEETNHDLNVSYRISWRMSEKYGFIRHSTLINHNDAPVGIGLLDGIQNLLPFGIDRRFQLEYSTLADAYKKSELQTDTGLGIFHLSSIPVDRPEPSEALKATTVWCVGLENSKKLISSRQLPSFEKGIPVEQETDARGVRGAYFVNAEIVLESRAKKEWYIAADVGKDASGVAALMNLLRCGEGVIKKIEDDISDGTENLRNIVAGADGLQSTGDLPRSWRHFSNVMFNVMRGGIFDDAGSIEKSDFIAFLTTANGALAGKHKEHLDGLSAKFSKEELLSEFELLDNPDLERLCREYLPLTFSRRHGDPSRPWNIFSIRLREDAGNKVINYEGNWRDIFQNWEALALSYPEYTESMIAKFCNSSTADGYNPYRITKDGFDWEVLDQHDAWSYIGYWGDHQIIYLLKLLEISAGHNPDRLQNLLSNEVFAYANVPYRIKPYGELLKDPKNTVVFDAELQRSIEERVRTIGNDGKFVFNAEGGIIHVNLAEKLLLSILTKFSNFIPEAGIWLNTQRPEWNDANNALVGYGVSMVTLYYLRRYVSFFSNLLQSSQAGRIRISEEVSAFFDSINAALRKHSPLFDGPLSKNDRRNILDDLGAAGSEYRTGIYNCGCTNRKREIAVASLLDFCRLSLRAIDHSIRANKRKDKLYHAYNLMTVEEDGGISIRTLYEMLEGQVAIVSSGFLRAEEAAEVLDALRASALYREDQCSYLLYPDRRLPRFAEKNNIPEKEFRGSELLQKLVADGNTRIVACDIDGGVHFNGNFRNGKNLKSALDALRCTGYGTLVEKDECLVMKVYENTFDHRSFTGRSGTFYKYEGLGCIYWHMVSKLLLAVQETALRAYRTGEPDRIVAKLRNHYTEILDGVGVHKSPAQYGAFPTDPYSHTPGHIGVQQPGLTGQVKEDIISRLGEFGVVVGDGTISFHPCLLQPVDFLTAPGIFHYIDIGHRRQALNLPEGTLAFTFCQVPVVYHRSEKPGIHIRKNNGATVEIEGSTIDCAHSSSIFKRDGCIRQVDVSIEFP